MSFLKNRTVVGVSCILLSILICFGVTPLFQKATSEKTEIVRVTKEIKAGDEITGDMVQMAKVGGYGLPENVIRQTDTVVGKYAAADLSVGDYICLILSVTVFECHGCVYVKHGGLNIAAELSGGGEDIVAGGIFLPCGLFPRKLQLVIGEPVDAITLCLGISLLTGCTAEYSQSVNYRLSSKQTYETADARFYCEMSIDGNQKILWENKYSGDIRELPGESTQCIQ